MWFMEALLLDQCVLLRAEAEAYGGDHFTGGAGKSPEWV